MELEYLQSLLNLQRGSAPLLCPNPNDALWLVRGERTLKILSKRGGILTPLAETGKEDIMVEANDINPVLSEQVKVIKESLSGERKNA